MRINIFIIGMVITSLLMAFAVPYSIYAFLDTSIPFNPALFFIAGISMVLFGISLYYYRNR